MNSSVIWGFGILSFIGILMVTFIIEVSSKLKSHAFKENEDVEGFLDILNKNKALICFGLILSVVGILGFTISIIAK